MVRRVVASILVLIGGAAALFSVAKPWYKGREGSSYQLSDLFSSIGPTRASFGNSLWVPMIAASALALLAIAWQQGWMALTACVIVLGFTILWIAQQTRADGQFVIASNGEGINQGVTEALVGGLLLLVGGLIMPLRGRLTTRAADGREKVGSGRYRPEPEVAAAPMAAGETAASGTTASAAPARAQEPATSGAVAASPSSASPELEEALKAADQVNQVPGDVSGDYKPGS